MILRGVGRALAIVQQIVVVPTPWIALGDPVVELRHPLGRRRVVAARARVHVETEVVRRAAGADHEHAFIAQRAQRTAEREVPRRVARAIDRHLHERAGRAAGYIRDIEIHAPWSKPRVGSKAASMSADTSRSRIRAASWARRGPRREDALEWIASVGGGHFIDGGKASINNPKAAAILNLLRSWVGTISPRGVTSYGEEEARIPFTNGNAAFMRNWPYAYSSGAPQARRSRASSA